MAGGDEESYRHILPVLSALALPTEWPTWGRTVQAIS
jgi:hypothetical protein